MIKFLQTETLAKKVLFCIIIFGSCIGMLVYLIPGGLGGDSSSSGEPGVLVKVGDEQVTFAEAQRTARNMMQQQFGGKAGSSALMPFFMQRAVQDLIAQKAMQAEAQRMGLRVSDKEIADFLQNGPLKATLFPDGKFIGDEAYGNYTESSFNLSPREFEQQLVASSLLTNKLRAVVEAGVTVSDEELHKEFLKKNTKVKFEYAVLTTDEVTKQIQPADAELRAYYERNQKRYENSNPEKRQFQYVVINPANLREHAQVTPADLQAYYNAHLDTFRVQESVKVRHILINTPTPGPDGKTDPKAMDAARARAEDILKQIKAGGNFEELAKKFSEDSATAGQGGEMGWVERGRTDPAFEKAAFLLAPGQVSDIVQTGLGFSIIQVEEKQTAHLKPLSEVKDQIEPQLVQQKAAALAETLGTTVRSESRNTPLAAVASKHDLQLLTSPMMGRVGQVEGVPKSTELLSSVFAAGKNSAPELVDMSPIYVVYQVTEIQPASTPTFEEAKSRIEEDFKRERSGELLTQKLQEISDRAKASHDLKKAATEGGATLKTSEMVGPDSQVPDIGALTGEAASIFDLKVGDVSSPIRVARGGVVVSLLERQDPAPADFDKQKDDLRESLLAQKRSQIMEEFIETLRRRMEKEGKIRINKKEMDRLMPGRNEES